MIYFSFYIRFSRASGNSKNLEARSNIFFLGGGRAPLTMHFFAAEEMPTNGAFVVVVTRL